MKTTYKISEVVLLFAFCFFSCKKFVTIPPPSTQIVTENLFTNDALATAAQLNIYNLMVNNGESYSMSLNNGLLADELKNYNQSTAYKDFYANSMNTIDFNIGTGPWVNAYSYIYQANAVISGLQNSTGASAVVKQQLNGEALFIRAFWHFYLANCFGDVPLVLGTDYNSTSELSRTPRVQVLQQVIIDLKAAQTMLNDNYVDLTDTATTSERIRPNKATATALLARAYLYLGNYSQDATNFTNASAEATSVIGNSLYSLSTLNSVFLKNSSEAIWQLQVQSSEYNGATADGSNFILTGAPSNSYSNSSTISMQLLNSFEPGDNRQAQWIGSYSDGTNTWYFPNKYQYSSTTAGGTVYEYTMVLRLGEQFIIRAEAEAELGDSSGAINDLNMIRQRAG